ncbi:MAG TPA: adenylate/guanylate cyclase domain-containing protein [Acidimicrobiales bacterium]|nr:adenylate/guanylate cyclase domain-containing protein [Acidimicrobiales bacterium]
MERPETKYVAVGNADVAYKVIGDGPIDLLYFYGVGNHVEFLWDTAGWYAEIPRLASFSRLVVFDRRGGGASDRLPADAIPTWEEWAEDIEAVLDAVGSSRAAIFALADAGPIAMLFAAMHPERVTSLVLVNTAARYMATDDYPIGVSPDVVDALVQGVRSTWGTREFNAFIAPTRINDQEALDSLARAFRCAQTPRSAAAQVDYMARSLDVRQALSLIQAPTLVFHSHELALFPIEMGRYVAEHITGARFIEMAGGDGGITPANISLIDDVEEFLTGERPQLEIERILTTIVFTDIVGSTERAASVGDQRWRSLLDAHDKTVRGQLRQFRGREINTTGDGFVASFDGPARAIRCAHAIVEAISDLGIDVRIGMHTGECEVRGEDLGGLAVHIAARVGAFASPGETLVSRTVKDLVVGSGIEFEDRGEHELKGVPGSWQLFAVSPEPTGKVRRESK